MLVAIDGSIQFQFFATQCLGFAIRPGIGHHHRMRTQYTRKELVIARLLCAHGSDHGSGQRTGVMRASAQYQP